MNFKKSIFVVVCLLFFTKQYIVATTLFSDQSNNLFYNSYLTAEHGANRYLPSLNFGGGVLTYYGDINKQFYSKINYGYHLGIEQSLGGFISISLNGLYGKLSANDKTSTNNLNFESQILQGDFNFNFHLDKAFSPYITLGIGYLGFNPYGDLKDAGDKKYYYWGDGSIKDLPETALNIPIAKELQRDYSYETQLFDSVVNYSRTSVSVPLGAGFQFKLLDRFSLKVGATYNIVFSDWVDNYKSDAMTDKFLYTHVSLGYHFSKHHRDHGNSDIDIKKIDEGDSDGDGINDFDDNCPGTPKGYKVNKFGCLDDSDKDGIPDYKDKEPNSQSGAIVDADGITLSEELIAKRKQEYEMLATGKLKSYVETEYINHTNVEGNISTSSNLTNTSKSNSLVPQELQMFDKDNNGQITTQEISMAIDGFFEGEPNITVQKLNKLIDFFFEQ